MSTPVAPSFVVIMSVGPPSLPTFELIGPALSELPQAVPSHVSKNAEPTLDSFARVVVRLSGIMEALLS
jgi:hypothetical protein